MGSQTINRAQRLATTPLTQPGSSTKTHEHTPTDSMVSQVTRHLAQIKWRPLLALVLASPLTAAAAGPRRLLLQNNSTALTPLNGTTDVGATPYDAPTRSMTFGFTAQANQNGTALTCTPTQCSPVMPTPSTLQAPATALNNTVGNGAALNDTLQIVSNLARQASSTNPAVSQLVRNVMATYKNNPVLAAVANATGASMAPSVWGFVHALVTTVKPGVQNPQLAFDVTRSTMQALYPTTADIAVWALQAMAQNGTMQHFVVPGNETLASQPELAGQPVPQGATHFVSPFSPRSPWQSVAATSENATAGEHAKAVLGLFTGNYDWPLIDAVPGLNTTAPGAYLGKSEAQALMTCFTNIAAVGQRNQTNLLPPNVSTDTSGLFPTGAVTFTEEVGGALVNAGPTAFGDLMSQIETNMTAANIPDADKQTVRQAYADAATLIGYFSPLNLTNPSQSLRTTTESLVIQNGGIFTEKTQQRFAGFGANVDDLRACGVYSGRTQAEVLRRITHLLQDRNMSAVRVPMLESDVNSTLLSDPQYRADIEETIAHVGRFPNKYVELSMWHNPSLASNAGPSRGTVQEWLDMVPTLKKSPQVIVGLVNEPTDYAHNDMLQLNSAFQNTITSLRNAGVTNLIAVQGSQYGRVLTDYVDNPIQDPLNRTVYETHLYGGYDDMVQWLQPCLSKLVCMVSEIGWMDDAAEGVTESPQDFSSMMEIAAQHQIPMMAWAFSETCPPNLLDQNYDNSTFGNGRNLTLSDYGKAFFSKVANLTNGTQGGSV